MPASRADLFALFERLGIASTTIAHPPVHTVEDARARVGHLPGGHCKNLFLKDKKGGLWLVVCLDHRRTDINLLAKTLGAPRFSFGRAELLMEVLGVEPGSVTPFALINDGERRVQPVLDQAMLELGRLNYHPLANDATTGIAASDLPRFLEAQGYHPIVIDFEPLERPPDVG